MKRSMFAAMAMLVATAAFAGQDAPAKKAGGKVYAHFTTNLGKFTVELFEKDAPKTVANFVGLAEGTKEWKHPAHNVPRARHRSLRAPAHNAAADEDRIGFQGSVLFFGVALKSAYIRNSD